MKKFFLLSSISVFIGLISLVFYSNQAYAMPPFEVPPAGGFPACQADLNTCTGNLSMRTGELIMCTGDLSMCTGDLAACDGFVDNGDGTVTDVRSGLMWEKKVDGGDGSCLDDDKLHSVDARCNWFDATGAWITKLNNTCNNDPTVDCTTGGDTDCIVSDCCGFACHRDWRLPEVDRVPGSYELESIVSFTQGQCVGGGGPCISPVFGLTRGVYWSAIEVSGSSAWAVNFFTGGGPATALRAGPLIMSARCCVPDRN